MHTTAKPHLSSIKSLSKTILNDKFTFRWFRDLILKPQVRLELNEIEGSQKFYKQLQYYIALQRTVYFFIIAASIVIFFSKQYPFLLLPMALGMIYLKIQQTVRAIVSNLSLHLISKDFPEETLGQYTLFQIGEFYTKKFNVNSLVSVITSMDNLLRNALLVTLFLGIFIFPLNTWQFYTLVAASYLFFSTIIMI